MSDKIKQSLIGGIVGTGAMTLLTWMAPLMGFPKMSPPDMLAGMLGLPVFAGWLMHFMIGAIFALAYAFLFIKVVRKIISKILKGALFGIVVFVFAQIMMAIMEAMLEGMPAMGGSVIIVMIGSIMGHLVYGVVVALFNKE
jgi:hypothetical protein